MSDLEQVQPDPVKRAIVDISKIIQNHLREHVPELERDETFSEDMQTLHDIARQFDPRIVISDYLDPDWDSEE